MLPNPLTSTVPSIIFLFFTVQLLFVQNFVFLPSGTFLKNIDGLIFFHLILIMIGNLLLIILGFLSQSRYSLLGVLRAVVHVVSLDTFITVIYILLLLNTSSGNFHDFSIYQFSISNFLIFFPAAGLFLIILLLEAKRSPFDHAETESEVVAGYATEYAGIFLLTFYLIEYFHLIIAASHIVILFLGG